jgi:hypothetical protein
MDHVKVLRRAWEVTWRYRVLWVFGVILAFTTSQGGGRGGPQYNLGGGDLSSLGGDASLPDIAQEIGAEMAGLIPLAVGLGCLFILLIVAFTIARYVAETALIRLVDEHEETGEKRSLREGIRMGWSRRAWRLFLINLLIDVPIALAFIVLFLLAAAPLLLWVTENKTAGVVGTVASVGMFVLFIFLAIIVAVVVTLLKRFFHRACALEGLGVIESIRHGFALVKLHLKDVAVMWLIMVGVGIGLGIAMFMVVIFLLVVGLIGAGVPAAVVGGLASLAFEMPVPLILGLVLGILLLLLLVGIPALFLRGLIELYKSSVWTLTYREVRALESVAPGPAAA